MKQVSFIIFTSKLPSSLLMSFLHTQLDLAIKIFTYKDRTVTAIAAASPPNHPPPFSAKPTLAFST